MIKKLQIKFVATTMSILLVVFIAVLGSINLIMHSMMQSQSRLVLNQIASNIRYDEDTSTFSFKVKPDSEEMKNEPADTRPDLPQNPSENTVTERPTENTKPSTEAETSTTAPELTEPDATPENTEVQPAQVIPDEQVIAPENPEINTPNETEAAITTAVAENNPEITMTTPAVQNPTNNNTPQPDTPDNNNQNSPSYRDDHRDSPGKWWENPEFNFNEKPENNPPRNEPYWNNDRNNEWNFDWNPWNNPYHYYYPYCYSDEPETDNENNFNSEKTPQENFDAESIQPTESSPYSQVKYNGCDDILDSYSVVNNAAEIRFNDNPQEINALPHRDAGTIDYFVLMADNTGRLMDSLYGSDIDSDLAQRYINSILNDGSKTGMIDSLQFYKMNKSNGTVLVFTDKSTELDMLDQLNKTTILIGCVSFFLIAILVIFLSKMSIQPVKKAFEKQKQFVSDASHELKTPLTIISTNADVLADEIGENKWLTYIKSQTDRMSLLVNDLLNLTRLENNSADIVFSEFNLSQAILNTALPFECQAFEANKKFEVDVQEGIMLNASERHVKQMAAILIDNAIKHSGPNGEIKITLSKFGDKKALSVFNTGSSIPVNEREKVFERFYRSDNSRARSTGGYGLGLAIAKSIIDYHKFKISITGEDGKNVCFTVVM